MRALRRLLTGEDESGSVLGLDGKRPLRPFRLSVLTTAKHPKNKRHISAFHLIWRMKVMKCSFKIYLLWPFPLQGTSGSDSIGTCSSCVCPQGSFWQPNTHTWHFFALCAAWREEEQYISHLFNIVMREVKDSLFKLLNVTSLRHRVSRWSRWMKHIQNHLSTESNFWACSLRHWYKFKRHLKRSL